MSDGIVAPERFRIRDLVVDVGSATVMRGETRLLLPPRTLELLVVLARRYPRLVRRQELLDAVWPDEHVGDETLSHRIMVLRRALGDSSSEPTYVVGERGFGYRLQGRVEALGPEGPPSRADARPGARRRHLVWSAVVVGVAGAALLILPGTLGRRPRSGGVLVRIAVGPIAAAADAPDLAPIAEGLKSAIASQLRRLSGVLVVPEAGSATRPDGRVVGTVSGTTGQAEVCLRLVDGANGREAWARRFPGSLYEILNEEDVTARVVAEAAYRRFVPEGSLAPTPNRASPAVRRLCLRGDLAWLTWTEEGTGRADAAWGEAARIDPGCAPAQAGSALSAVVRSLLSYEVLDGAAEHARAHAQQAVALDARLPAAHVALGLVQLLFDRDLRGAQVSLRRAWELEPDDPLVLLGLALHAQARGRYDESVGHLRAAARADADAAAVFLLEGRAHQGALRWRDAVAAFERALRIEPGLRPARRGLAESLASAGREREALAVLQAEGVRPRGASEGEGAQPAMGRAWQHLCRAMPAAPPESARACLLAGDLEEALRTLGSGRGGYPPFAVLAVHDPLFRPLRGRPGFDALVAQVEAGR